MVNLNKKVVFMSVLSCKYSLTFRLFLRNFIFFNFKTRFYKRHENKFLLDRLFLLSFWYLRLRDTANYAVQFVRSAIYLIKRSTITIFVRSISHVPEFMGDWKMLTHVDLTKILQQHVFFPNFPQINDKRFPQGTDP